MNKKRMLFISMIIISVFCILIYSLIDLQNSNKSSDEVNEMGVNIHFTGDPIDISLIKESGLKVVRMDLLWSAIEKQKGVYDFKSTGYDKLTDSLINNGLRPYYILDYSNPLYEKNKSITTKEDLKAFINFVAKATSRYKGKHIIWEIWNEPNGAFWEPKPNYDDYSRLVKSVSTVIKKNDPTGMVVAPALAGSNKNSLDWLNEIFKRHVLDYIDAVSVHPYRNGNPETVVEDYASIRSLISKYTHKKIPIISGEWGYSIGNEQKQSEYTVRMFLINMYENIKVSIWYDWKNDGSNPNNLEDNFGLRENDVKIPKLAYFSVKTLTKFLADYHFSNKINVGNKNDYVLSFKNAHDNQIVVCWTTNSTHNIKLPSNIYGQIISMYGEKIGILKKNNAGISVSNSPVYIIERQN